MSASEATFSLPAGTDYSQADCLSGLRCHSQCDQVGTLSARFWAEAVCRWLGRLQTRYKLWTAAVRLLGATGGRIIPTARADSVLSDGIIWKRRSLPILASEIYNGENYDAGLEQKGWDEPYFPTRAGARLWFAAGLGSVVAQNFHPIRINQTLKPKTVTNPKPGVYVFDGQNMGGWAAVKVAGKAGTRFKSASEKFFKPKWASSIPRTCARPRLLIPTSARERNESFEPHFTFPRFPLRTNSPATPNAHS